MSKKRKDGSGHSEDDLFLKGQSTEKPETAKKNIYEFSNDLSDKRNGGKRVKLKAQQAQLANKIQKTEKDLAKKETEKERTNESIERPTRGEYASTTQFFLQNIPAFLKLGVFTALMLICFGAGFSTAYSNLMASQIEVFEQNPFLAVCIAMLVPIGGMCIDTVNFRTDTGERRYAQFITVLALTSLAVWIGYFAQNFSGMSAEISSESISENPTGTLFTILQCVTELLCGAVMGLRAKAIYEILFGYRSYINPKFEMLSKEITKLEVLLADLNKEKNQFDAEIRVLEAEYNLDARELYAHFTKLKKQYDFNISDNGDDNA